MIAHSFTGVVCRVLSLSVLILDSQASSSSRFIAVGPSGADPVASKFFILLHRTRREHFNLITLQSKTVFGLQDLPGTVTRAWRLEGSHATGEPGEGGDTGRDSGGEGGGESGAGGGGGEGRAEGGACREGDGGMPAAGAALRAHQHVDLTGGGRTAHAASGRGAASSAGAATAAKEMEDKKKDTEAKGMKEHVCGKCSGAFKTALGLKVHISKAHSKDKAAEEEEEEEEVKDVSMVCDRCGRADFKNLQVPLPRLRLDVVPDLLRFHHSSLFRVYHSVYSFVCVVVQWRKLDEGLSFLLVCTCLPLNASLFYIQGFKLHKTRWCKAPAEALAGERPADAEHSPQSTQSAKAEDDVVGAVLFKVTTPRTCRKARNGPQTGQEEGGS